MEKNEKIEKEERQVLVFDLLNQEMGLDISSVREVLKPRQIHPLPQAPKFIEGVVNLRDHIIAVIDLRKRFDAEVDRKRPALRIIVCRVGRFIVGLVVDSVIEVISLSERQIEPEPEVVSEQIEYGYVSGIARLGERVIMILDLAKLLTKKEITELDELKK